MTVIIAERSSTVDAAVGVVALGGLYLAAVPFWHDIGRELRRRGR